MLLTNATTKPNDRLLGTTHHSVQAELSVQVMARMKMSELLTKTTNPRMLIRRLLFEYLRCSDSTLILLIASFQPNGLKASLEAIPAVYLPAKVYQYAISSAHTSRRR